MGWREGEKKRETERQKREEKRRREGGREGRREGRWEWDGRRKGGKEVLCMYILTYVDNGI